ncbi:MAG TPA: hypothetical protein VKA94_11745, partial [Hyphomicrobiales bacterium]|nr:hypothetical protein [Hyphomicrobiales bacterium]
MSDIPHKVSFCGGALIGGQSGELHFINDVALWILNELGSSQSIADTASIKRFQNMFGGSTHVAEQAINETLEWIAALKDDLHACHSESEHTKAHLEEQQQLLDKIRKKINSLTIVIGGQRTRLIVEDEFILFLLKPMIAHLLVEERDHEHEVILTGVSGNQNYVLYVNGECQSTVSDLFSARHLVLEGIALASVDAANDCFSMLHAAAVVFQKKGIIILGPSGVGKTTLLLELLSQGAEFISDDIVPLSGLEALATSVPFAIGVKQGSWKIADTLFDTLETIEPIQLGDRRVKYAAPESGDLKIIKSSHPIHLILMPEFSQEQSLEVCRLNPIEALNSASQFGSWFNGRPETLLHIAD